MGRVSAKSFNSNEVLEVLWISSHLTSDLDFRMKWSKIYASNN
jgi:hypothetical protein